MALRLLLATLAASAHAAGMNTHTFVGHRTLTRFGKVGNHSAGAARYNEAIEAHGDAVLGGSDMPDFLYACGRYPDHHDAGEYAHWPPFQAAAVRYLRARADWNASVWSNETARLVAFVFGVGVHYIADELWEGLNDQLGAGQGFVRTLASFNLGRPGVTDDAESIANMAADFAVSWSMDESAIAPWRRDFPVDDIVAIYHVAGFPNVTRASIADCRLLFDLGLWAEKSFGWLLFHLYAEELQHVPMAAESALDLLVGGIDDMAVWAANAWQRIARWMDDGPPANPPPRRRRASAAAARADAWVPTLVDRLRPWARDAPALMRLADASTLLTRRSSSSSSLDLGWSGRRSCVRRCAASSPRCSARSSAASAPAVTIEPAPAEVRVKEEAEPSTPPVNTLTGEAPVATWALPRAATSTATARPTALPARTATASAARRSAAQWW